ncbi:MAG: UDP-N-acetylmuramate--L-alanine ligase [Microbacteriaceae bacterium]|nr:UDP-N-acetylmuramate--L-alanine ligase [Microbacteriaceae bacterium]
MTIKPDLSTPIPEHLGKVHFIGIGGSGMSGIARMLLESGHVVTGSDVRDSSNIQELIKLGAKITIGHDANNLADCDTVVVTSALWPTNPEYVLAQEKKIPILHRSQALRYLTKGKRLISVAGAHGKTTSTGMIITALKELGEDPGFVNGGVIAAYGSSSASGSSDLFVIEADESDGSFLFYDTAVALITNVDPDHLDHYGSLENFEAAFARFGNQAKELVAISSDDEGAVRVTAQLEHKNVITFGFSSEATVQLIDVDATGPKVKFSLRYQGESYSQTLLVPGVHNAINAAGAFAVLVGLGYPADKSIAAIATFAGTERRFELHGIRRGVSVYDDFAHHPTEVRAALTAARAVVGSGRLVTVFQPHLYSRTRLFAKEFAEALALSDEVVVLDIYAAREDPEPGVTGALIADAFADQNRMHYVPAWDDVPEAVADIARTGDFVITMGCGDVYRQVPGILKALET